MTTASPATAALHSGAEPPALIGVAHGSRDAAAGSHIRALLDDVAARRPELAVHAAFVELTAPTLPEVLATLTRPAVVVPLLLARGYHVAVDVPQAAASWGGTTVTGPLGPDPLLADILVDRLREAGGRPDDAVVLAAAGSRDPGAAEDAEAVAAALAERIGRPVTVGYGSAARPTVADAVAEQRRRGRRVAAAAYLLAPGFFASRLAQAGADVVTAPLCPHPLLAEIVLRRYDAAA